MRINRARGGGTRRCIVMLVKKEEEQAKNLKSWQESIGSLQEKYSIGSFELLSKTAPIQSFSLLVLGPIIDYYLSGKFIGSYKMSSGAILFILLSCSLAVFCNVSQYLCIGRFSAVSFQVLGHMKTVCVLTLGWLLFDSELTFKNIMGMLIAVIGMIIYSWAMEAEKQSNTKITSQTKNSLTEEEIRLLKVGVENTPVKDIELGDLVTYAKRLERNITYVGYRMKVSSYALTKSIEELHYATNKLQIETLPYSCYMLVQR
ncbi:hypothetical protein TEA_009732 [Camellia sinensis var. sinensis]|uniref:Sugar phosphate transporter domain-containing protein n=1 Tax=Camellia sinensis var. sinensis TaxID=542762 RepID=A0A4S4DK24_CAMSN|nr:hypothetical protein TEA_009732 [Camellia sinensis var. sinensis]